MRSRGCKILSVVCSAALCVALLPVAALSGSIDPLGEGIGGSAVAVAQPAPPDEGIASEQGATAVTFAQLKEQTTDEDYPVKALIMLLAGSCLQCATCATMARLSSD